MNRSVHHRQVFFSAEAEVVYVAVDANRRKMRINEEHIPGLEDIEQHETS